MRERILIVHPPRRGNVINASFYWVARYLSEWLSPYYDVKITRYPMLGYRANAVIYVGDCLDIMYNWIMARRTIVWCDTVFYKSLKPTSITKIFAGKFNRLNTPVLTASIYNKRILENHYVRVDDVVPRLVSRQYRAVRRIINDKGFIKQYDVMVIGYKQFDWDRKNIEGIKRVLYRVKKDRDIRIVSITNDMELCLMSNECFDYSSLSTVRLYNLLSRSRILLWLSKAEGFGMPPAEAMSVGTPVVYSYAPAHNEFCYGWSIPIIETKMVKAGNFAWIKLWIPDEDTAVEQLHRALDEANEDHYRRAMDEFDKKINPYKIVEKIRSYI